MTDCIEDLTEVCLLLVGAGAADVTAAGDMVGLEWFNVFSNGNPARRYSTW